METRVFIWPSILLSLLDRLNGLLPGYEVHRIGNNSQWDRDVHNLLDRFPPHLRFLPDEEKQGQAGVKRVGIPEGAPFVCLNVRDSAYLDKMYREQLAVP